MHRFRWFYSPELLMTELGIFVIIHIIGWILSLYHRKKKRTGTTWRCTCSRINKENEYACICGRTKLSVLASTPAAGKAAPTHNPQHWVCTCGRENPPYQSSCACGKSKREI